jgi:SIR2-like protein
MRHGPKKRLLIILGAGSSVEMGMPSVAQIDALMRTWSADWSTAVGEPDYLNDIWNRVDAYCLMGPRPSARKARKANFEWVLGEMVALRNWLVPAPHGNALSTIVGAPPVPPGMVFSSPGDYGPAMDINSHVVEMMTRLAIYMRNLSRALATTSDAFIRYSQLIGGLRDAFDVGIYNLNYDTVALNAWPGAFTGFGSDGKFKPDAVHNRTDWGFIYHLHGSVHHSLKPPFGNEILWQDDLAQTFDDGYAGRSSKDVSDGKSLPRTSLIAGGFKLDQLLADPFQSLYASLIRHVHTADAILLGGYGFGDPHVNESLSNRLSDTTRRPPVMVLDYSDIGPTSRSDPMECRGDAWEFQLCRTLNAASKDFREPGHYAPPDIYDLVPRKGFEVNAPQKIAIWHGGLTAAAERLDAVVPWLDATAGDDVLAGIL